jgi:integrase
MGNEMGNENQAESMAPPRGRRLLHKLSALQVKQVRTAGRLSDGGGLYLNTSPSLSKSWVFRYSFEGKHRWMGLGSVELVSLSEARETAQECRRKLRNGICPLGEKEQLRREEQMRKRAERTFRDCATELITKKETGWRNEKHQQQWTRTLETYAYPFIGDLPVNAIGIDDVKKVLEPIWNTKNETAGRVRGRVEKVLDFATIHHYRDGDNPARWKGNLELVFAAPRDVKKVQHRPALPHVEIPAFWRELVKQPGISALSLQFTILTAARTTEVRLATWEEFDLENKLWTIPAERMKAKRTHRVPLSAPAIAILREMYRTRRSEVVFPYTNTGKPQSGNAMLDRLKKMNRSDITVHGFRSTFRDWAAECTEHDRLVAEHSLAHSLPDKSEAAYLRTDLFHKRQTMMDEWAAYCTALVSSSTENEPG